VTKPEPARKHPTLGTDGEGPWHVQLLPSYWDTVAGEAGVVRSYWLAARRLSEVAATERSDALFVPVAFLWRHTIELALKRGTRWLASEVEEDGLSAAEKKLMGRHDLLALWTSWELRRKRVHPRRWPGLGRSSSALFSLRRIRRDSAIGRGSTVLQSRGPSEST
jgi:hypothetical protein